MSCRLCGAKNISLSLGGPDICPACDCYPPKVRKAQIHYENQIADLTKRLEEAEGENKKLKANWDGTTAILVKGNISKETWRYASGLQSKIDFLENENKTLLKSMGVWEVVEEKDKRITSLEAENKRMGECLDKVWFEHQQTDCLTSYLRDEVEKIVAQQSEGKTA